MHMLMYILSVPPPTRTTTHTSKHSCKPSRKKPGHTKMWACTFLRTHVDAHAHTLVHRKCSHTHTHCTASHDIMRPVITAVKTTSLSRAQLGLWPNGLASVAVVMLRVCSTCPPSNPLTSHPLMSLSRFPPPPMQAQNTLNSIRALHSLSH